MTGAAEQKREPGIAARANRAEVKLACEIRQGLNPWVNLMLHDISETGFRMDWHPGLSENKPLTIRIAGLQSLSAAIRWKREGWIGCEFTSPLYAPVYDNIVRQSRAAG